MNEQNNERNILVDDPQIAENDLESIDVEDKQYYEKKREKLKTLRVVKQSWSIAEIVDKLDDDIFLLEPSYQRSLVWNKERKDSFIESLFMNLHIPPIYLAEVRDEGNTRYEVVDGKQRLNTIYDFCKSKFKLNKKNLDYYDYFDGMNFDAIDKNHNFKKLADDMLSHVVDCYVIKATTDEEIKYDIFSRINKGAVILTADEIRVALYNSPLMEHISKQIEIISQNEYYDSIFTKQAQNKKKDFGRIFRSLAFAYSIDTDDGERVAIDYRSRPKDFINNTLLQFKKKLEFNEDEINKIIKLTIKALYVFLDYPDIKKEYYIDSLLSIFRYVEEQEVEEILLDMMNSEPFIKTLEKSPATTSNVNFRINYMNKYVNGNDE